MVTTLAPAVREYGRSLVISTATVTTKWQEHLPTLHGAGFTLRELRAADAPSLLAMLSTEEVSRFISPPPTTVEGYERFIAWTHRQRAAGQGVCFGIVPDGCDVAVGIIQVRSLGCGMEIAEWGFALGAPLWGTGLFMAAAAKVLGFTFNVIQVQRLEARACVENGRGNGVLIKLGARCEAMLRRSFLKDGVRRDQYLWAIDPETWASWVAPVTTVH